MVSYCEKCGKPRKVGRGQACVMCEIKRLEDQQRQQLRQ